MLVSEILRFKGSTTLFTTTPNGSVRESVRVMAENDIGSQIVMGLQTIVSRQSDLTKAPAVVTVGAIRGGTRWNIIPEDVELEGTIRTFDPSMQNEIHERVKRTAEQIAASAGATAEVSFDKRTPVTWNDRVNSRPIRFGCTAPSGFSVTRPPAAR